MIIAEQTKRMEERRPRRSVDMHEPYGARVVAEPEPRPQGYIVGHQTRQAERELQAVVMLFKYVLTCWLPTTAENVRMLEEVDRINWAVLYANNDLDWDWLEGIGERFVAESDESNYDLGDKFLYSKRWWKELSPCPLAAI